VQQNAAKSFIMMSPIEKLGFLEQFAFQDINLTKLKMRCRAIIKERNEQLIATTSQLEMASSIFTDMEKPTRVPFPLDVKRKSREKAMKNEVVRYKNSNTLIRRVTRKKSLLEEELNDLKVLYAKLTIKKESVSNKQSKLDILLDEREDINYEGDDALKEYEEQLVGLLTHRELLLLQDKYDEDKTRLEEMQDMEMQEMQEKISNIEENLWTEYSEKEVKESIAEFKLIIKDIEKLERLKKNLEKYIIDEKKLGENKKELERCKKELTNKKILLSKLKLQQELYHCPSCAATLRFQDDDLHLFDDDNLDMEEEDIDLLGKEISSLTRLVNRLEYIIPEEQNKLSRYNEIKEEIAQIESQYEDDLPDKDEMESDIEYMNEYKRAQQELMKKKKRIQQNIKEKVFSSSLETFQSSMKVKRKKIKALKKSVKSLDLESLDEQELRDTIASQRRSKDRLGGLTSRINTLTREIKDHKSEILDDEETHTEKYKELRSVQEIEGVIDEQNTELEQLEIKMEQHKNNVAKIEEYKIYKKALDHYNEWKEKVSDLTDREKNDRQRYAAATLLKEKILEAESIAILNVIESINAHAQEYLDLFFPNNPINVRLLPFKQTKKKTSKPQINIQIDYKGMEADMNMLSGGEMARVVLAYTLALAEIFNSPLILLDECTASLDQDLTGAVVNGIRANFTDKMVLIIAHQVVSGIFDREIKMTP
jgi:DNA repair exonuclease SbcCD ATPase subunit